MKNKIKAFSLSETIIILTVLAVAIAASIPIMTKKMVNVSDAGSTITGASHGRYEIFTKEVITTPDGDYEKTTKPPEGPNKVFGGGKDSDIIVFRRLYDEEYIKVTNTVPTLSKNGKHKSTLYEQIKDVTPIRNSDGEITFVEYKKLGVTKKVPVGGNIIVENANLVYKKGCLNTSTTPKQFVLKDGEYFDGTKCNIDTEELPTKYERIIEGNFANRCYDDAKISVCQGPLDDDKNTLWLSQVTPGADSNPDFELKDTPIPWEKIYSGSEPIIDRPIAPSDPDGDGKDDYIGTFDPGEKAINVVVHAVGGGGAGGGLGDPGSAISPKGMSSGSDEMVELAKDLTARFNKARGTNFKPNQIISFVDDSNFGKRGNISDSDGKYIYINTANGTITGKIDVRQGNWFIFPNELLDYTKILGTSTQKAQIFDMPVWGTWTDIKNSDFRAGAGGCGTAGGNAEDYSIDSTGKTYDCKYNAFCGSPGQKGTSEIKSGCNFHCCCATNSKGACVASGCACDTECTLKCKYNCTSHFKKTEYVGPNGCGNACPSSGSCPNYASNIESSCIHTLEGGNGGAAPPCAIACTNPIVGQVPRVTVYCTSETVQSFGSAGTFSLGSSFSVRSGSGGNSCYIVAHPNSAMSEGGGGGKPCAQTQTIIEHNPNDVPVDDPGFQEIQNQELAIYFGEGGYHVDANGNVTVNSDGLGGDAPVIAMSAVDGYSGSFTTRTAVSTSLIIGDEAQSCLGSAKNCASYKCGVDGTPGFGFSSCGNDKGIDTSGTLRNHIYTWTIPYMFNRLTYGEAGQAGEYKTTKIAKVDKPLQIKLGLGGVWKTPTPSETPAWEKGTKGPDGTDTIVKMGDDFNSAKSVLVAKGGKGGSQKQLSDKYDLCFPYDNAGICKGDGTNQTKCCNKEKGMRSTRDIISTALNLSAFENIKSLVGNSLIIGTGTGRGGEGAGTRAGVEEVGNQRYFMNSSTFLSESERTILIDDPPKEAVDGTYENKVINPSEHNFRGGDGAVIITW